jgi:ABC-type bacteriocin/lantibiotic exporter with double-glycine peptidase domain
LLLFYSGQISEMSGRAIIFSLFWLGLINVVIYFFTKKILQNDKKYKKRLDKEWAVIDKERSNITLIENMGLTSEYRVQQRKIKQDNERLYLKFGRTKSLSKTIPNNLLIEFFPFLLLGLSGNSFNGKILIVFWWIFSELSSIFRCLWDYTDYTSSRSRINDFLTLPEKNDNLKGIKLDPQLSIKTIKFENISFRYAGQKEWIISNYNHTFSPGQLNFLRGKNGTGKSTKLYLLLGVIRPQKGKVVIELENQQTYELHQDINLASWRANNMAYCAHETLVEEGSTGQKQLANINRALATKKDCQIFLFDEADNALDEDNQKEFREKIKELAKNKLVIYIKH